ncbi:hypothetical protein EfmAA242_02860 [Enterococcus faecium]|nr:hypothetical protein EfmAA242_02860 [Enterococcus faecium]
MNYLKRSLGNAWDFLKGTQAYFRDVLLMHGFILFICLPLLSSTTRFILHRGAIDYLSYDNIPSIFSQHPGVLLSLIVVLMTILLLADIQIFQPDKTYLLNEEQRALYLEVHEILEQWRKQNNLFLRWNENSIRKLTISLSLLNEHKRKSVKNKNPRFHYGFYFC